MPNAIPDKVKYTKAEKIGEAAALVLTIATVVLCLLTVISDAVKNGGNVIVLVVTCIEYGAFTLCSVFPQWTNIMYHPENCTEKKLHTIRRGCIVGKLALVGALLFMAIFMFLYK